MASPTNAWRPSRSCILYILLQSLLYAVLSAANATMVTVGYLWEHPLRVENNNASEAIMDHRLTKSVLRLICDISPPLPSDDYHLEKRNELVKWVKVKPKYETVKSIRYWSNDMTKTAISFSNVTLDVLGTYECSYGGVSAFISVLVSDVKVAETLERPGNFLQLKTYVTFMKDKSGLDGWSKDNTQILKTTGTKELCPMFGSSKQTSQSVHELRVSDIKVIAAMGDTFTVGLGARATSLNEFFIEYRDVSWSIGGGDHLNQSTSLPNIIKQFSPTLKGASMTNSENMASDLNVAFSGASARDLEDQAKSLVSRMKNVEDIDYQNDWKMATVWIGTDDLCHVCRDKDTYNPSIFIKYVMRTLNYLQRQVPKLFVNLVPPMDVTSLRQLHEGDKSSCQILGWNSCECLSSNAASDRQKISDTAKAYKRLLEELVNSGLYGTQENFAVVIQPALSYPPVVIKDGGLVKEYFGLDCFHFTVRGHAAAALALWKNMLEPYGRKTEEWGDEEILKCPSKESPFVFTRKNSNTAPSQAMDNDDDESAADFPPTAAVALAVCFTAVLVIVVVTVWRSRGSRRRPESLKLLYAPRPHRPRI